MGDDQIRPVFLRAVRSAGDRFHIHSSLSVANLKFHRDMDRDGIVTTRIRVGDALSKQLLPFAVTLALS